MQMKEVVQYEVNYSAVCGQKRPWSCIQQESLCCLKMCHNVREKSCQLSGEICQMCLNTAKTQSYTLQYPVKENGRNGAAVQTSMLLLPAFAKARRPKLHSGLTTPSWIIVTAISIMVSDTGCNPPSSFDACKRHLGWQRLFMYRTYLN